MNSPAFESPFFQIDLDSWDLLCKSHWAQEIMLCTDWPCARRVAFHLWARGFSVSLVAEQFTVRWPSATEDQESVCAALCLPSSTYCRPSTTPFML